MAEFLLLPLENMLSRVDPPLVNISDLMLSDVCGLPMLSGSADESLDMPGRPLRPEETLSLEIVASSLLFLYAADPMPRSAVCLNHEGSRAPRDAAIWSRLCSGSSTDVSRSCVGLLGEVTIDVGLLPPSFEPGRGRCCHESVPDRARFEALGVDVVVELLFDAALEDVEVVLDRLIDPKPLNSGMSPPSGADGFSGSMVELALDDGRLTEGELAALALEVMVERDNGRVFAGEAGVCCFCGEMDRARSKQSLNVSPCARVGGESVALCSSSSSSSSSRKSTTQQPLPQHYRWTSKLTPILVLHCATHLIASPPSLRVPSEPLPPVSLFARNPRVLACPTVRAHS